jgi:hypothetical protein
MRRVYCSHISRAAEISAEISVSSASVSTRRKFFASVKVMGSEAAAVTIE